MAAMSRDEIIAMFEALEALDRERCMQYVRDLAAAQEAEEARDTPEVA